MHPALDPQSWTERFDDFRRGRLNTGYQTIRFGNGRVLEGSWEPASQWTTFGLPEDCDGMRVLDIGSNLGGFCLEALKRGAKVVNGIDKSKQCFEGANALHSLWAETFDNGMPVPRYFEGRFEEIHEKLTSPYDAVFAFSVLQHTPTPRTMLSTLYRLLNASSNVFIEVALGQHEHTLAKPDYLEPVPQWQPTRDTVVRVADELGFETVDIRVGRCEGRDVFRLKRRAR